MKAAVYYGKGDIRVEEVPVPEIEDDQVLVEMKACGICGSDLMDWYLDARAPIALGHEPTGIIAKIGSKVKEFNIGDRVFAHHHVACLTCHYCSHGDYTLCEEFHNSNIKPGGLAEYFMVPASNLQMDTLKIPRRMTFEEATLIEPVGCCIRALKKCNVKVGDSVGVIGAGTTGLIHTALAKIYGAAKVIIGDLIEFRLKVAEEFGADVTVNVKKEDLVDVAKAETEERGIDVVIVTAPSIEAYRTSMKICRAGGKICVFAPTSPGEKLQVNLKELFFSEVQIVPSYSTSHLETREASELIRSDRINVKELITHKYTLTQVAKAFKTASQNKNSLKVVVVDH
jgi:L-iditol 2-dehydrogenase